MDNTAHKLLDGKVKGRIEILSDPFHRLCLVMLDRTAGQKKKTLIKIFGTNRKGNFIFGILLL